MDEHKTNGMTEFLQKEIRAWNDTRKSNVQKGGRRGMRALVTIAGAAIVLLFAAVLIFVVPWGSSTPPDQIPIPPNGGESIENTLADNTEGATEAGSQPDTETQAPLPIDHYAYDYAAVPVGATPIVPRNIANKNNPVNQTDRVIDMQSVMASACKIPAPRGKISVLIIHTHTGEGYNRENALWLDAADEEFARSTDGSDGVVAVGTKLAQVLNQAGIGTIHCKTVFDGESNRESYDRAAEAIKAFRLAYPSLVCVIDVHRAGAVDEQGHIVRSLAVRDGQGIAQTQVFCGMRAEQTSKTNLALAMLLCQRMNAAFPDSCAGVVCKEQALNQDLAPFSLTLEIGSSGNTLAQALDAASVTANALCTLFETN